MFSSLSNIVVSFCFVSNQRFETISEALNNLRFDNLVVYFKSKILQSIQIKDLKQAYQTFGLKQRESKI